MPEGRDADRQDTAGRGKPRPYEAVEGGFDQAQEPLGVDLGRAVGGEPWPVREMDFGPGQRPRTRVVEQGAHG